MYEREEAVHQREMAVLENSLMLTGMTPEEDVTPVSLDRLEADALNKIAPYDALLPRAT